MNGMTLLRRGAAALLPVLALSGCINAAYPTPTASLVNIEQVRKQSFAPVSVGSFALGAGLPPELDKGVSVRGSNTMSSPYEGSFAAYLRETLVAELKGAGKYDAAAPVAVSGWLTASELSAGGPGTNGTGRLAARFVVKQAERTLYDNELSVSDNWPSAFMAVEAVPAAFNGYGALYGKLVGKLFADESFRQATAGTR